MEKVKYKDKKYDLDEKDALFAQLLQDLIKKVEKMSWSKI